MTMYEYHFGDGYVMRFYTELPFTLLKLAVDKHCGLMKCKKVIVIMEEVE